MEDWAVGCGDGLSTRRVSKVRSEKRTGVWIGYTSFRLETSDASTVHASSLKSEMNTTIRFGQQIVRLEGP